MPSKKRSTPKQPSTGFRKRMFGMVIRNLIKKPKRRRYSMVKGVVKLPTSKRKIEKKHQLINYSNDLIRKHQSLETPNTTDPEAIPAINDEGLP